MCLDGSVPFQPRPSPLCPVTHPTVAQVAQTKKDDDWLPRTKAKDNLAFEVGMLALIYMFKQENAVVLIVSRK